MELLSLYYTRDFYSWKVAILFYAYERTVKPFVICRKNFLFCDTEKGAEASAIICTIIETANRNNLNPYEYLNYLRKRKIK